MSCQICVGVCPFEAIKMDKVFELSTRERFDALLQRKSELSKSNTYYHSVHPIEAAEVDSKLAEAEAKKKPAIACLFAIANPKSKIEIGIARVAGLADAPDLGKRNQRFQNIAFQFEKQSIYERKTHFFTLKAVFTNDE